jgi:hypothetical protein
MKPQDIVFFAFLALLVYKKDSKLFVLAGISCLILSIPLFSFWIFFTAERLVMYASVFFLLSIIFHIIEIVRSEK